ncbi:MAG TPA: hypothetical protein VJR23_03165 [Candidatus Acidoferrales bacterium]|nr:hypothetical protein [Candidatus Acidoferrales bacterium]
MDRRRFLQNLAVTTAAIPYLNQAGKAAAQTKKAAAPAAAPAKHGPPPDVEGHTLVAEFKSGGASWKVYEDLRTRDGAMTFISSSGASRVMPKSAEASFPDEGTPYLGLKLDDIGMQDRDLLADKLLEGGDDPDEAKVKAAAPPLGPHGQERGGWRLPWDTFVGTKECFDTMPVFPGASTRTYHPGQYFPEINREVVPKRFEGLVGGWMPAVRKVYPNSETSFVEAIVFGDPEAHDKFIVQTWHRTALVENGKFVKVVYGYSYPDFPPARVEPKAEDFYRGMLAFADYWEKLLHDYAPTTLPQNSFADMAKYAFAKELMTRPGGVYPKYGAVDRDYSGSEYDGFQDIFTMSVYANLECGRTEMARTVIDNYLSEYTDAKGMINMRGPETAQFGMTLMLLARYFNYTGDAALLQKHREKIEATAKLLLDMHDESLQLPKEDAGYGLIHGWSESDSCLSDKPMTWWLPYFANNAFSARGLRDLARVWPKIAGAGAAKTAGEWTKRAQTMQGAVVASMRKTVRHDMNPPYIGTYPGPTIPFRESMKREYPYPHPQQWPHRGFAELLEADMLPADLANLVIDCMRAYGGTTLGVVANIEPPHKQGRDILGFISYGYAQMLLRLDRVEEYLLFLYSHRYHDHTRGSWTAGEVTGITGEDALFCIPAQQTIPLLVRWMLVLEDSDEDRLYFAKGVPRDWVVSGKEITIEKAPTRWGRVSLKMKANPEEKTISATIELARAGAPKEVQLKLRAPKSMKLQSATVNGKEAKIGGTQDDVVLIAPGAEKRFEVVAHFS